MRMCRYDMIMADLDAGMDHKAVAKKYGADRKTVKVYDLARTNSLPVYLPPPPPKPRPEAELPIVDLYRAGHDIETIARMKHINVQAVSWELEVAGVTKRGTWTVHVPTEAEVDQIVALYSAGESARLIARRFRMSEFRVRKYLELRNVQAPLKGIYALTEADWLNIARMYGEGMTLSQIGAYYHVAAETLSERLKQRGVHILTRSEVTKKRHRKRKGNKS